MEEEKSVQLLPVFPTLLSGDQLSSVYFMLACSHWTEKRSKHFYFRAKAVFASAPALCLLSAPCFPASDFSATSQSLSILMPLPPYFSLSNPKVPLSFFHLPLFSPFHFPPLPPILVTSRLPTVLAWSFPHPRGEFEVIAWLELHKLQKDWDFLVGSSWEEPSNWKSFPF